MSADPWENLLQRQGGGRDPWESLLAMPQVGATPEGIDAERAAGNPQFAPALATRDTPESIDAERAAGNPGYAPAQPSPDQRAWYNKPWDEALGEAAPGALDSLRGAAVGITGAFGANMSGTPQAHESVARSPSLFGGARLGSEVLGQAAVLPMEELGGVASGAIGGAMSGWGSSSGPLINRLQAAGEGALMGAGGGRAGELAGNVASKVGGLMQNKVAPWFRDQGLLNRAASTGRPVEQLSKELGGRQGVIDAGQWMENNGMTQWSPNKLNENLRDYTSMRTGDQRSFLDELAQNPDAYPVNTGEVANGLSTQGNALDQLAASSAQTQGGQYSHEAQNLMAKAPDGAMPFEQAWQNRQAFDTGAKWQSGAAGDRGLAEVNRDAANGMRGAMGDALDNTSPELRPRWDSIQGDLSNSLTLSGAGDANAAQLGIANIQAPLGLRSMAAAAGGGFPGYAAAVAAQSGGRGMAAGALGKSSQALDWLGSQGDNVAGGMQALGREGGETASRQSRGYLLPQAAQQMMQQPGSLGPYAKQFFDAARSQDQNALSALITKLSHTDTQFRLQVLPKLQQLTAEGGY